MFHEIGVTPLRGFIIRVAFVPTANAVGYRSSAAPRLGETVALFLALIAIGALC
jgi:hypothetical protein